MPRHKHAPLAVSSPISSDQESACGPDGRLAPGELRAFVRPWRKHWQVDMFTAAHVSMPYFHVLSCELNEAAETVTVTVRNTSDKPRHFFGEVRGYICAVPIARKPSPTFAERIYEAWWPDGPPPVAWADLSPNDRHRFHEAAQLLNHFVPSASEVPPAGSYNSLPLFDLTTDPDSERVPA